MVRVESFTKIYENAVAVDQLCFEVQPGQVLGLVGRNGAGKTTSLKSIAGIIPVSGGKLYVQDYEVSDDPIAVKQRSAYVPDDPQLFNDLSVEQHLIFTAGLYGIADPFERISELLDTFEISEKRHTPASDLSRGMKQKLAVSCALLQQPAALLLDEPMTGLDPQGIRRLKETITQQAAAGSAVIISSHLLAMVEDICSHVMILERGQQKFFGTLDELKSSVGAEADSELESLEEVYFATLDLMESSSAANRSANAKDDAARLAGRE